MVNRIIAILLIYSSLIGCDHFPGPILRSEFPGDIKVFVDYEDGTRYTDTWGPCLTVSIGSSAPGRFGMEATGVEIKQIRVEFNGKTQIDLNKDSIRELIEKAQKEKAGAYWVLNQSGISFSKSRDCALRPSEEKTYL